MTFEETPDTPDTTPVGEAAAPVAVPAPAHPADHGAAPKRELAAHPKPAASAAPAPAAPQGPTFVTVGRRKEAVARVRMIPGTGVMLINHRPYEEYFPREAWRLAVRQPLLLTHQLGKWDVRASIAGGGLTGQAGAVRLGLARALVQVDPALRSVLRGAGLLTRDPRMKERKKYGQKGARKRFQWTKR